MTTFYKKYTFTSAEKDLLRNLLVYEISQYDSQIALGNNAPFYARRSTALDFLFLLNGEEIGGNDSVMVMMDDIIKLCKPISEETRSKLCRTTLNFNQDDGLIGILSMYDNETILGLKSALTSDDLLLSSTSSFCS